MSLFAESSRNRLKDAGNEAALVLDKLHGLARNAEDAMEQAVWSLSSHHDNLRDLAARMQDVAYEVCADCGIACEFIRSSIPGDILLREKVRKDIFLVFRESLNNVVKHSGARRCQIAISAETDSFVLSVRDDGRGFETGKIGQKLRGGNGVHNMRIRAQELGAAFSVTSAPGSGTIVEFTMRIAHMHH
jgi:signal transduction histidine kinase